MVEGDYGWEDKSLGMNGINKMASPEGDDGN